DARWRARRGLGRRSPTVGPAFAFEARRAVSGRAGARGLTRFEPSAQAARAVTYCCLKDSRPQPARIDAPRLAPPGVDTDGGGDAAPARRALAPGTEPHDLRPLPFQVADHAEALDAGGCGAVERDSVEDDLGSRPLLSRRHGNTRRRGRG